MKLMNAKQHPATAKLLLGVLMATCVFTGAANAQPSFVGKFTLPYEVHWGRSVLPAGEYSILMDSKGTPAEVYSTNGNISIYTGIPIVAENKKGPSCLTVTIIGNERRVRSLNLPGLGSSFIFDSLSNSERETYAKAGEITAVPVVTAKK